MKNVIKIILIVVVFTFISCHKENKRIKISEVKKVKTKNSKSKKKIKKVVIRKDEVYILFDETSDRKCTEENDIRGTLITAYYQKIYNDETIDFYFGNDFYVYEFDRKHGKKERILLKNIKKI